jgi:hypothetical protein
MGRNCSVRITKKRSKIIIKNKTYRNKRGRVGGFFSSFGEPGANFKRFLRYNRVVSSTEIFKSFTGCRDDASCTQIILEIVNGQEADKKAQHTLTMLPNIDITLDCSDAAYNKIQKLYDSINAEDKAKLYGILKQISEIQEKFKKQIDELEQDTDNKKNEIQEKIDKITKDIKDLKTALDVDEIKKADRDRTKSYRENMNDQLMENNVLLATEIQGKKKQNRTIRKI